MTDVIWEGSEELRQNLVPVLALVRHPKNPRRGRTALIAESLTRFGQVRPILTDGNTIIAGNHTYAAAVELGWTHVAAIRNEFADEAEARAYLLADNRLPELGSYDEAQRMELLEELEQIDSWAGTGYTIDELEDLRAMYGAVPETAPEEFQGDFALTAEELEARRAHLGGGTSYDEVVLTLTQAESVQFDSHTRILRQEYGLSSGSVSDVVLRAVNEAAKGE